MFWRSIKYIQHFFHRKYRKGHHIHSPYVFELVNAVVFAAVGKDQRKAEGLVRRIMDWSGAAPAVLAVWEDVSLESWKVEGKAPIVIVREPYQNRERHKHWKRLISQDEVRVSIDLFHMGILLLRPDLHKTHYRIKI